MGLAPPSPNLEDLLTDKVDKAKEKEEENKLSPKITIMKPILRFIQLLCENHNLYLQNLLRDQNNKTKYKGLYPPNIVAKPENFGVIPLKQIFESQVLVSYQEALGVDFLFQVHSRTLLKVS